MYIAKKFESTKINIEDLISIGSMGLLKGVQTFKMDKNIKLATYASRCIENEILMYIRKIANQKNEISLDEPMGMDSAQVTAGGVLTEQFDPVTLESYLVPGLYACGEVLDIDGDCGGYNLQWAWSSGRCAGLAAGKDSK